MKITDQQLEVLLITQEECAEVVQAISKTLRFGTDSTWNGRTNQERLEEEVGDLLCMIDLMKQHGLIDDEFVRHAIMAKQSKLQQWSNIMEKQHAA
jgi:NTP pyrophosphatase (non-canonical NTP hydrolase)